MAYYPPPAPTDSVTRLRAPRISGTAMPHGVFLSTGTAGSASGFSLLLTGFAIVSLGLLAMVPTYLVVWLADQGLHRSLAAMMLQVGQPADPMVASLCRIGINLVGFFAFLSLLRLSPLAGYHAAEHMTVHAIEDFGVYGWEAHVRDMPRAHLRCGSNLLAGFLPALLIGGPLLASSPLLVPPLAVAGWMLRHRLGFFLQNTFTTKPPSEHQLAKGMEAGRIVLARWLKAPAPRLSVAQRIWRRGLPQMVVGVILAVQLLGYVSDHLHLWLDW